MDIIPLGKHRIDAAKAAETFLILDLVLLFLGVYSEAIKQPKKSC